MIPRGVRLPCQADPAKWDVPASVNTAHEAAVSRALVADALRICRNECPVTAECHAQAVARPPSGAVMGGWVWSRNRRPMRFKEWDLSVRRPNECGTRAARDRHRRLGDKPCDACDEAEKAWDRRRKRAAITACPKGHEYTPGNTIAGKRGQRVCRTCRPTWGQQLWKQNRRVP
ncbi:MAG: hypothetical protein ACRDQ7_15640 [Haloechinothrix sp.]